MFGSNILDTAIALTFIFLVMSLLSSAMREMIESFLKQRALDLEHGIRELLQDPLGETLVRDLYSHPLIFGLFQGPYRARNHKRFWNRWFGLGGGLPSYIPSDLFARALLDLHHQKRVRSPAMQDALRALGEGTDGDPALLQANVQRWFDQHTERVSGWYKRRTQGFLLAIGLVGAIVVNVNTITMADRLFKDTELRAAVVATAQKVAPGDTVVSGSAAGAAYQKSVAALHDLAGAGLPMGWRTPGDAPWEQWNVFRAEWWSKHGGFSLVLGWLLTALAVSLGAPFWFDLLNKFMVVRSTVKPSEKSGDEGSKDAQPDVAQLAAKRQAAAREAAEREAAARAEAAQAQAAVPQPAAAPVAASSAAAGGDGGGGGSG
ncbi:MAG TPA: hypothetical protein VF832_12380, partial [Longimicrobiales bacterium]